MDSRFGPAINTVLSPQPRNSAQKRDESHGQAMG